MLQIRVFQFSGNYKVKLEASESCRRHAEKQLGGSNGALKGMEAWPCQNSSVFILCMGVS